LVYKYNYVKGVYLIFKHLLFVFFFAQSCMWYIKIVIYHFHNADRCHLTLIHHVLILLCGVTIDNIARAAFYYLIKE